jgi:hypothetical protein
MYILEKSNAMAIATERISVLLTPTEKTKIAKLAKVAHLSIGEFLCRAAASFRPSELSDRIAAQQHNIDALTERMIRLEAALEIVLVRSGDEGDKTRKRAGGKQQM